LILSIGLKNVFFGPKFRLFIVTFGSKIHHFHLTKTKIKTAPKLIDAFQE